MATVELVLDSHSVLGESPVSSPDGWLHFVDINGKKILGVHSSSPGISSTAAASPSYVEVSLPSLVGCIVPRARGGFLAALEENIVHVDVVGQESGQKEEIVRLADGHRGPKIRFNDGKCDPLGRFWVGSMHSSWRDPSSPAGHLYMLSPPPPFSTGESSSAHLEVKVASTRLSNGMAWSQDESKMFFIDSALRTVDVFDFSASSAEITNRRTVVTIDSSEPGVPDGMCIDAAGHLWVVVGESGTVRQFDSSTGLEICRVSLPVKRPTSCAFGGTDLSHLYVTTREETGDTASAHAGGLFRCLVPGVKGASHAVPFAG